MIRRTIQELARQAEAIATAKSPLKPLSFPYLFGNAVPIKGMTTLKGKEVIRGLAKNKEDELLKGIVHREYSRLLHRISVGDLDSVRVAVEGKLSRRIWIATQDLKRRNQRIALINPDAPLAINLLHGRYIVGGYISRQLEYKAELHRIKLSRSDPTDIDLVKYKRERSKRAAGRRVQFLLSVTAEVYSNRKLCLLDSEGEMSSMTGEDEHELHYVTLENVLLDTVQALETNASMRPRIDSAGRWSIVDIDYMLKGNPHLGMKNDRTLSNIGVKA